MIRPRGRRRLLAILSEEEMPAGGGRAGMSPSFRWEQDTLDYLNILCETDYFPGIQTTGAHQ